jgi:hypothetical protein
MKKHAPTETRYHIHRQKAVGIAIIFMILWWILEGLIRLPSTVGDEVYNYLFLRTDMLRLLFLAGNIFLYGAVLVTSTVTGRSIGWALRVTILWILIAVAVLFIGQSKGTALLILYLTLGIIGVATVHRVFTPRHYSIFYDVGTLALYVVAVLVFLTFIGQRPYDMLFVRHVKTIQVGTDTYHLAEVFDWSRSPDWDYNYDTNAGGWVYEPTSGYALFNCKNRYSNCTLVRSGRVLVENASTLDLTVYRGDVFINYKGGYYIHDPNDQ